MKTVFRTFLISSILLSFLGVKSQKLKINYKAPWGLQQLNYNGEELVNFNSKKGNAFFAERYRSVDKNGKETVAWSNPISHSWDDKTRTYTVKLPWGQVSCRYLQEEDTLNLKIELYNTSVEIIKGVSINPLTVYFGQRPSNLRPYMAVYKNNTDFPSVVYADLPSYRMVADVSSSNEKTYIGLMELNGSDGKAYRLWTGNYPFIGMRNFDNKAEITLLPGQKYSFTVSLRFLKPQAPLGIASRKQFEKFRNKNPRIISWKDKRPIGMLFLSSYDPANVRNKTRGWKFSGNVKETELYNNTRLFRSELLAYANRSVKILKDMKAQGMITWDIEGQQYPHPLSYIGSPELLQVMAPEMQTVADEYFSLFRKNGLRTGICIRPDSVVFGKNSITHKTVTNPTATLINKIRYAKKRWGCTIFYIDSNIDSTGETVDAVIFKNIQHKFPDVLLIPEHERPDYFAYTMPYGEFRFGDYEVIKDTRALYKDAGMALVVPDGMNEIKKDEDKIRIIRKAIDQGNILLFRAWYEDPVNRLIKTAFQ